jgi:hypothetical protein
VEKKATKNTTRRRPPRNLRKTKNVEADSSDSEQNDDDVASAKDDSSGGSAPAKKCKGDRRGDWEAVEVRTIDTGINIKKPLSAYMFFNKSVHTDLKNDNGKEKEFVAGSSSRIVSQKWKELDAEGKAKYEQMAQEDKERYEEECHQRDVEVEAERDARRKENESVGERKRKTSTRVSYSDRTHDKDLDDVCMNEDADDYSESDDDEDKLRIEHILAMDTLTSEEWATKCASMNTDWMNTGSAFDGDDIDSGEGEVTKFLIKWKEKSHLHVTWQSEEEMLSMCKGTNSVVRGYINRFLSSGDTEMEAPYFPQDFVTAERIIKIERNGKILSRRPNWWDNSGEDYKNMEPVTLLVKWTSMGYSEGTEEFVGDIKDKSLIQEYFDRESQEKSVRGKKPKRSEKHFQPSDNDSLKLSEGLQCRDYQLEGVNWLVFNWHNRRNSLLADEMGLGKTITSSCFIKALHQKNVPGPFLVIAPLSTLQHWQREVEKWAQLNAVIYQGSAKDREVIREHEFMYSDKPWKRTKTHQNVAKFDVLIASYETCLNEDFNELMDMKVPSCLSLSYWLPFAFASRLLTFYLLG